MILEKIKSQLMQEEQHDKDSFWASDSEKDALELYLKWKGVPVTNPIEPETKVIFTAGKMIEEAVIKLLGDEVKESQVRVEMEREGVQITGYIDAVLKDGTPMELKSYYGDYQDKDLEAGNPKTSYLKQLAIYMDFLNVSKGYLVYFNRGTGQMYQFTLNRDGDKYTCNNISFDLRDTYSKWAVLKKDFIDKGIEPNSDYQYKYPISSINWSELSTSKISSARNGSAVIGDYQVKYSPYKNYIVSKEAKSHGLTFEEYIGYDSRELELIKELTKGYSARKK